MKSTTELSKIIRNCDNKIVVHLIGELYEWKGHGIPSPTYCNSIGFLFQDQKEAHRMYKAYSYLKSKGKIGLREVV